MISHLTSDENQSLMEELNKEQKIGTIGGYCEEGFPVYYANDRIAHMLGYENVSDLIAGIDGKVSNTIHPDDMAQVEKDLNDGKYYEGMTYKTTYRMPRKDGTWFWTVDRGKVITTGDGRLAIISFCTDMSDFVQSLEQQNQSLMSERDSREKELERALEIEEQKNEVIESLANVYEEICSIDLVNQEYTVVSGPESACRVAGLKGALGYLKKVMLNKNVSDEHRDEVEKFIDFTTLARRLKDKIVISMELKALSGKWYLASFIVKKQDEQGNVTQALMTVKNIDEQKKSEIESRENLEKAVAEAEQANIVKTEQAVEMKKQLQVINALGSEYTALYLVDCVTGLWSVFKDDKSIATETIYEKTMVYENYENAIYAYIEFFVAEEDQEDFREHAKLENLLMETPDTGIYSLNYDRILEGEREHWQLNSAKFTLPDGKDYLVLGFRNVHDIVEKQISQENALRDALLMAKHASRAKTTFLNNMSHDIRTPMNAIIGFTALAQTRIENHEQVQEYLGKIHTSSTHLLSLINEILDMSRIESGTVKLEENIVHIPDILHDLRTIIQGQAAAKQQNLYIDSLDVVNEDVVTDKLRLNQVLLNIVSNAIKYTGCGGNIVIRVTEKPCSIKEYTTYEFRIRDDGMGMSQEFKEHVFDAFARERSSTVSGIQGTGLGMSITKNIVDLMNGSITVESELGKGTEFVVTVDFKLAENAVHYVPIRELQGARALVVDDDVNTCQSVSKMLRSIEMRPDWSTSGREALIRAKEAEEIKDGYKAYIIDYLMPDMNGIETVRQIRKVIGDEVPIIVLTAYEWSEFEDEAREAGVTAFVSKPIFMSELREVLTRQSMDVAETEKVPQPKCDYSGKRVLLVEDNDLNREIATIILEDTGIVVDTAKDGIEAINIMNHAREDQYDLIFMDIQMPKMDGYTATREIRTLKNNKKANIPIVAMTANAFDEDRRKSFEAGMNGHIAKPIDMAALTMTLNRIFGMK